MKYKRLDDNNIYKYKIFECFQEIFTLFKNYGYNKKTQQ